jgi:ribonucleoside-diphosphate reductase beta chain
MAMDTAEAIRKVEEAPLSQLLRVDVDEVEAHMDHLLGPETDPASLYRRWETQQWAVSDLDLSQDRQDWDLLSDGMRMVLRRTFTGFFLGEQAVTDTLGPVLHAAPREDERVFLATQVADEARHTVFFQRLFAEILGLDGSLGDVLAELRPSVRAGYSRIFDVELVEAIDRVRIHPDDMAAWVEAVVTYHLIIEGYLAVTGQRQLLRTLKNIGLMPGFVQGFTAVARDESRHIGFGVLVLRRRMTEDPELARVVVAKVHALLDATLATVVAPDLRLPFSDLSAVPANIRQNPLEIREFAVSSLCKRLRAAGIGEEPVADLRARAFSLYDELWARYEEVHQVPHPVRWWQQQDAASATG